MDFNSDNYLYELDLFMSTKENNNENHIYSYLYMYILETFKKRLIKKKLKIKIKKNLQRIKCELCKSNLEIMRNEQNITVNGQAIVFFDEQFQDEYTEELQKIELQKSIISQIQNINLEEQALKMCADFEPKEIEIKNEQEKIKNKIEQIASKRLSQLVFDGISIKPTVFDNDNLYKIISLISKTDLKILHELIKINEDASYVTHKQIELQRILENSSEIYTLILKLIYRDLAFENAQNIKKVTGKDDKIIKKLRKHNLIKDNDLIDVSVSESIFEKSKFKKMSEELFKMINNQLRYERLDLQLNSTEKNMLAQLSIKQIKKLKKILKEIIGNRQIGKLTIEDITYSSIYKEFINKIENQLQEIDNQICNQKQKEMSYIILLSAELKEMIYNPQNKGIGLLTIRTSYDVSLADLLYVTKILMLIEKNEINEDEVFKLLEKHEKSLDKKITEKVNEIFIQLENNIQENYKLKKIGGKKNG